MIDFFDYLYYLVRPKERNNYFYFPALRFFIRNVANLILKPLLSFNRFNKSYSLNKDNYTENFIVSLTSFPKRINTLWLVIESIFMQSTKPSKIILWLSNDQFDGLQSLPNSLLKQQARGLEIRFCNGDLKSHKKYFYTAQEYKDCSIVTLDDDVFYHTKTLDNLIKLHKKFPNSICCNLGTVITANDGLFNPYKMWPQCNKFELSYFILPIGVGGVLYPPNAIHSNAFDAKGIIDNALYADDLWLKAMTLFNNRKVVCSNFNSYYLPVFIKNKEALTSINVNSGFNDIQLYNIRNYCTIKYLRDPFKLLL